MALVIVESPNKIPKIKKSLDASYEVMASVGHIMDLSKKKLGIEMPDFNPVYEVSSNKKDVVLRLKEAAKRHDDIYIATDADREGEAIAHNLLSILPKRGKNIQRVIFKEINKKSIQKGLNHPIPFDENLFKAQQARRITDRLVGFKVSPVMWSKGLKGTSAGRVQSAALKFIIDREKEIRAFVSDEYWTIKAQTDHNFVADFYGINGQKVIPKDKKESDGIIKKIKGPLKVTEYKESTRIRKPLPPFITSTMQQDAGARFKWTGKRVMDTAQSLFSQGLITYHRCFPGHIKVSTEKGLIPIRDIKLGELVDTINGKRIVTDIVKNKNRKIYSLKTNHGYKIEGSDNEPLMILDKDFNIKWVKMSDIKSGDFIALSYGMPNTDVDLDLSKYNDLFANELNNNEMLTCDICGRDDLKSLSPHLKSAHTLSGLEYKEKFGKKLLHINTIRNFSLPNKMSYSLGVIIGYLLSEGCLSDDGRNIVFYNSCKDLLNDFASHFNNTFKTNYVPIYSSNKVEINSQRIHAFLKWIGLTTCDAKNKKIPWSIFQSKNEHIAAFLKAYWEGDGSYTSFITSSEDISSGLKLLLQKIGVPTGLHINMDVSGFSTGNPCYNIQMSGSAAHKFFEIIGKPVSASKQLQAEKIIKKEYNNSSWYNKIPYTKGLLRAIKEKHSLRGNKHYIYHKDRSIYFKDFENEEICSVLSKDDLLSKFVRIKNLNIFWDEVTDCNLTHIENTWDLTVEDQHHYIAEGFVAHNTDSVRCDPEKIKIIRDQIRKKLGDKYLTKTPVVYGPKNAAQDAHEAIRPTFEAVPATILPDEKKLLTLIRNRFAASQMAPAQFDQAKIELEYVNGDAFNFKASGSVLKFDGFLKVYGSSSDDVSIPSLSVEQDIGVNKIIPKQHFTKPPPRYTEPSFVKKLEKEGIGRPSTYASLVETLIKRGYIDRKKNTFHGTEIGIISCDYLEAFFGKLTDVKFTADMEQDLDKIEAGNVNIKKVLQDFYDVLEIDIDKAKRGNPKTVFKTDTDCPSCKDGSKMVKKTNEQSVFLGCENWPKCGHTFNIDKDGKLIADSVETGIACPVCSNKIVKRNGKFGEFWSCATYPTCTWKGKLDADGNPISNKKVETTDQKCPECKNGMLRKMNGKFGEFLSCENYRTTGCSFTVSLDENGNIIQKKHKSKNVKKTGKTCPKCKKGEVLIRDGKFGKFECCSEFKKTGCKYINNSG